MAKVTAASQFLLDTNVVIGILNDASFSFPPFLSGNYCISVVTVMELYALAGMSKEEEKQIDTALVGINIIPLTQAIAKRAGVLARTRRSRGKPDLLIAATALELDIPLFTKNTKDFKKIPKLKLLT